MNQIQILENQIKELKKEVQDQKVLNRYLHDQFSEINKNFSLKIYVLESRMNDSVLNKQIIQKKNSNTYLRNICILLFFLFIIFFFIK